MKEIIAEFGSALIISLFGVSIIMCLREILNVVSACL